MSASFLIELHVKLDKEILVLFSKVQDADGRRERREDRGRFNPFERNGRS